MTLIKLFLLPYLSFLLAPLSRDCCLLGVESRVHLRMCSCVHASIRLCKCGSVSHSVSVCSCVGVAVFRCLCHHEPVSLCQRALVPASMRPFVCVLNCQLTRYLCLCHHVKVGPSVHIKVSPCRCVSNCSRIYVFVSPCE